jgi:uncharacterized protein CbrC (UPF0167 family)
MNKCNCCGKNAEFALSYSVQGRKTYEEPICKDCIADYMEDVLLSCFGGIRVDKFEDEN